MYEQLSSVRQPQPRDVLSEKHIIFRLAGETYGLPILQVQEIIAKHSITVLPNLPDHFRGAIWLRGSAIPIINLRRRLGFAGRESDSQTRVIIIDLEPNPVGIEVDEVLRVATIHDSEIEAAPALTCGRRVPYVAGVSEHGDGKIVIHLDIMKVLSSLEQLQLGDLGSALRASYLPASFGTSPRPEPGHPAVSAGPDELQPAATQAPAAGPANSSPRSFQTATDPRPQAGLPAPSQKPEVEPKPVEDDPPTLRAGAKQGLPPDQGAGKEEPEGPESPQIELAEVDSAEAAAINVLAEAEPPGRAAGRLASSHTPSPAPAG